MTDSETPSAIEPSDQGVEGIVLAMLDIYGAKFTDPNSKEVAIECWAKQLREAARATPSSVALTGDWIAVEDRLPSDEEPVLVYVPGNKHLKFAIDQWKMQREAPVSFSSATIETGMAWCDHEYEEVTHWKPLHDPSARPTTAPSVNEHPETPQCGFDRNASHSENTYVCTCGWREKRSATEGSTKEGGQR